MNGLTVITNLATATTPTPQKKKKKFGNNLDLGPYSSSQIAFNHTLHMVVITLPTIDTLSLKCLNGLAQHKTLAVCYTFIIS